MIEEETKEVKEASSISSSDKNLTTEKIEKLEKQEIPDKPGPQNFFAVVRNQLVKAGSLRHAEPSKYRTSKCFEETKRRIADHLRLPGQDDSCRITLMSLVSCQEEIKEEQKQEELKTDQSIPVIKIKNLQAASSLQYPNTLTNKISPAEGKQQDKRTPSRHKTQLPKSPKQSIHVIKLKDLVDLQNDVKAISFKKSNSTPSRPTPRRGEGKD